MLGIPWNALKIVLGYSDFHIEKQLKFVIEECSKGSQYQIDLILKCEKEAPEKAYDNKNMIKILNVDKRKQD